MKKTISPFFILSFFSIFSPNEDRAIYVNFKCTHCVFTDTILTISLICRSTDQMFAAVSWKLIFWFKCCECHKYIIQSKFWKDWRKKGADTRLTDWLSGQILVLNHDALSPHCGYNIKHSLVHFQTGELKCTIWNWIFNNLTNIWLKKKQCHSQHVACSQWCRHDLFSLYSKAAAYQLQHTSLKILTCTLPVPILYLYSSSVYLFEFIELGQWTIYTLAEASM